MIVPVGEWLPDQPSFESPGASVVQNVYPRTSLSYGPVLALVSSGQGLLARCQGAVGLRSGAGDGYVFAGDASKLYYQNAGSSGFKDVSVSGGYSTGSDQQWHFDDFADNILATQISNPIQSFVIGSSTKFAPLSVNAPQARYIAIIKGFAMAGNTQDPTYGARPQRLWWPAINDPTNWPTPGTAEAAEAQSDFQDVVGRQGWLTGLVSNVGPLDGAAFFQDAVFGIVYAGTPDIFSILPIKGVKGCVAPGSIVQTPVGVFYVGPDGFYLFDGQQNIPIGEGKLNNWFLSNLDFSNILRITATIDPLHPIVWVAFPSTANSGGNPDTILAFNYALTSVLGTPGVWSLGYASTSIEAMVRSVSLGYTLEQLDVYGTIENVPASLDSQQWQGNAQFVLSAFDASHNLNGFTGAALAATVETTEDEIIPGRRVRVRRALPMVDGGLPSIVPVTRNRNIDSSVVGSASPINADGFCPLNVDARYHKFRITLPGGSVFSHIRGVSLSKEDFAATGTR